MGRAIYLAAAIFVAIAALVISMAPAPSGAGLPSACQTLHGSLVEPSQLSQPGPNWACGNQMEPNASLGTQSGGFASFDLDPNAESSPRFLVTRIGEFEKLQLTVVDASGTYRTRAYVEEDVRLISGEPLFLVELPSINAESRAIFLQVQGMKHDMTLTQAQLHHDDPSRTMEHYRTMMFMCLLMGMMLAPILFDGAAWSALRSPFIIWHALLAVAFSVLVLVRSGLVVEFFVLNMDQMRSLLIMSLGFASFAACMYCDT